LKTIGHHACKLDGGANFVLTNAPFRSVKNNDGNFPFLGEGYYFWDNNVERAHIWGKQHYHKKYYILQCEIELKGDSFLDLVGNRSDMIQFLYLYHTLSARFNKGQEWYIGNFIEFLKKLHVRKEYRGVFPWKMIRVVDHIKTGHPKQNVIRFVCKKGNFTDLSPVIVICIYEINDAIIRSKVLIN
jgi:hypothetical protein